RQLIELANLEVGRGEVLEVGGGEAPLEIESVALGDIAGIPILVVLLGREVLEESGGGGEDVRAAELEGGDDGWGGES
ncbi:hypothetical protein NF717_12325, partial [Lactococcus formosensis]